jgi:DNA-binding response OmpR family regulator
MHRRCSILVVDDELVNLKIISSALKGEYDVHTSLNGHDAISLLEDHRPDLILLDVMMPEIDGFDLCKIIKSIKLFADIPVIFLTALNTQEATIRGFEIGGIDYLTKPFNIELLRVRVRNHIALKKNHDLVKEQRDMLARQKEELEAALAQVKQLEGLIPICMYCKKIRDDQNIWHQLEKYITEHSEAQFSHGMCPKCFEKNMQDLKNRFPENC